MKIKILAALLGAAFLFSACNDKWLEDVKPDDGTLAPETMFKSEAGVDAAFTGLHAWLRKLNNGSVTTWGNMSYPVTFEFMANDVVCNPSGWWSYEGLWRMNLIGNETSPYQSDFYWFFYYGAINNANAIIENIPASPLSEIKKSQYIAEAKALRGWAHWKMARVYAKRYTQENKPLDCIPYIEKSATGASTGQPRESIDSVYTKILRDLSDVEIGAMAETKPAGMDYRFDKYVAYGFRAQIKLEMGLWEEAAKDAAKALSGPTYVQTSNDRYLHGFNTFGNDWMWGVNFRTDQSALYGQLFAWTDFRAGYQNGYTQFYINTSFVGLFSATDIRRSLFRTLGPAGNYNNFVTMKFLAKDASYTGDYCYMRTSEMTLIQAEGLARSGATGPAQDKLFEIQGMRDPAAVKSTNTGEALIEEILIERRKELYGEIGVEFFDLRRLHRDLVRNGSQSANAMAIQPKADDDRWVFQIPQAEMQANPSMKGHQNPRN